VTQAADGLVGAATVAVLAQDLVWQERLSTAVERAGARPMRAKTAPELDRALECARFAIVDLAASAYDPLAAIERASTAGARVLAIGPHDDVDLRKRALARGADRVLAYRKLFEDGPATVSAWLASAADREPATGSGATGSVATGSGATGSGATGSGGR